MIKRMSVNQVIKLKCEGHTAEYEITNVINLFLPYVKSAYYLEALFKEDMAEVNLFLNESKVMESKHKVESNQNETIHKKNVKETLKRVVYEVLSELTGQHMPWGILTGIRPTKIVHDYLSQGLAEESISLMLKDDYKISNDKIKLMIEVAKQELDILSRNKRDEISVYIGIPFCPTRCVYCSFTAYSLEKKANWVDPYLEALCKEIDYVAKAKGGIPIRSLYIGGGTPTSLNETQLLRLLTHIKKSFDLSAIEEYTVEAGRPDTITREKLIIMKQMDVNRISINPQSMNQKTLDTIGRKHTIEDIIRVFHLAREIGHQNINMDIILGLPNESVKDVENTLIELSKLSPENITVHTLAVKRASRLKEEKDEYHLTEPGSIEQMLDLSEKHIATMGLRPYYMYRQKNMLGNFENVGYASPGKECIYNIEIMEEKESIIALGAGAITKMVYQNGERIDRVANVKSLEDYISRIDEMIERKKLGFEKYK